MMDIDNMPEYYVCKKDSSGTIKFKNGVLFLSESIFNETTDDDKFILWSILKNRYFLNINGHYENFLTIYNEWMLYGKSSTLFFKTFVHLFNKYSTDKRHIKIIQQIYRDKSRKTK